MDLIQAILVGIAIAAIFNGTVASLVLINPRFFLDSYPKAIQKIAPKPMTKQEKKINTILTIIIVGICFVYSTMSLLHSGVVGFWNIFWMGYIQWSILNAGDFLLLDCLLFQGKYKEKIVIPGTEGHKDYEFNNWMKHLAIREHFLLVPFFLVPIIATIQALFVGFLGR
ncbi:MAG: hypothetical protein E6005_06865 [Peptostreptococcus sp.]|uniref:Uncharacterized protein n=6 Tax=Peptostreptococcus TaxID=1257 RepID=D3MRB5_9FIRM|nr:MULTISPECIES: hypothetical protein [Bacillota]EFD05324.1 hypothetical protein HMPREF0631_1002 [Peptostreptococcus anaerobius 653-L]MBS5989787.1 hypothetical protein [Anaerococcus hydrogenalis]MCB6983746.1 hypothetical protein [Peptostreptococcus anaerobius]MCQ5151533.1 hypothetical protein [Peptostreptococcus anaerobius]MDB8849665.1 hypothetical protein [Peptostreptococcus anaerobius]